MDFGFWLQFRYTDLRPFQEGLSGHVVLLGASAVHSASLCIFRAGLATSFARATDLWLLNQLSPWSVSRTKNGHA